LDGRFTEVEFTGRKISGARGILQQGRNLARRRDAKKFRKIWE
jgi:hypothetical protein